VMGGEGVEGSHVDDVSCILGSELGMAVGGGVRRIVGPVWVCEKAHWRRSSEGWRRRRKKEKSRRGAKKGEERVKVNVE
jgi:hypothetical protein